MNLKNEIMSLVLQEDGVRPLILIRTTVITKSKTLPLIRVYQIYKNMNMPIFY